MFTNTYRPHVGGVARAVETLVGEYRSAGHAVQVFAPGFPGDEHEPDADLLRVPALQNFNGSDFSVRVPVPRIIARRIARFGPDLVHTHHPFLLGDAALRIAYEHNLPLVLTHHTLYEDYTHYVPFDSATLKRFVIRLATEYANCCDAVIAPSGSVAQILRERGVTAPVEVIPSGVDTGAFADADGAGFRAARGLPPDAPVIGHVGRLAREKNLPFLADAVASVLRADPRPCFLLVGDGPESPALKRRFEAAGVAGRVFAPGKLTGRTLRDAYAAMDLFAFSSQTETQGMVLAEAMAAGRPVVALDGPGVRDVVADGRNGRLLDARAMPDDMARSLREMVAATDPAPGRAAALETAAAFDQAHCAGRVIELYRTLSAGRRAAMGDWHWWDRLLGRIEAEWELISSKADSAGESVRHDRS